MTQPTAHIVYKKGWYSMSINPDDQHQYFGKDDRLEKFRNYLHANLLFLKNWHIDYCFHLELSEPTSNEKSKNGPRLHVHGIIRFRSTLSIKNFLLHGFYKLTRWSMIDIDTISDPDVWYEYCTKQQIIMKEKPFTNDGTLWEQLQNEVQAKQE